MTAQAAAIAPASPTAKKLFGLTREPSNSARHVPLKGKGAVARALLAVFFLMLIGAGPAFAWQFGVSATVQTSPAAINVSWDQVPWGAANYAVYRSSVIGGFPGGTGTWTEIALGIAGTNYLDTDVTAGTEYEYQIGRTGSEGFDGDAYLDTGINLPLQENRGKLILVVDNTYTTNPATNLLAEIAQLQSDLAGDGWTVIRHDVARTNTPAAVKSLILADYQADTQNVRAVFLLGRIPVLHSGNLAPDGHNDRPMPADGYYGDMYGDWSSSPSYIPADITLQVGRVDLYDMPSFLPLTDTDLLRQYLDRDHNFKFKVFTVTERQAEMTSTTGPSIQRQFFGTAVPTNIDNVYYPGDGYSTNYFDAVQDDDYLWFTKGTGGGQYTGCSGMGSTADFAASPGVLTVFNTFFASWFVEWDVTDNFLRAPLAAKGYALCNAWSDNPTWVFMHMGMGKNIGYSTRVSQNNNTYYNIPGYPGLPVGQRGVHIALMGDPTLRMHIVAPVSNLNGVAGKNTVSLSWTASPDSSLAGYTVYRSTSAAGPFTRLNNSLVTGTTYTDAGVGSGTYTYMVRTVKLEVSGSGSYSNLSQGIFLTTGVGGVAPTNQPPVVNAGTAQTITLPATATLAGSVIDDGLPNPPGVTTSIWTVTSGPGTVTFVNAASPITTASFSTSGAYVLRLTASDSVLTSYSEVTITVNPVVVVPPPTANSQSLATLENAATTITLTGSDTTDDVLTYTLLTAPAHGTLTGIAPNLTYTPNASYTGPDSFSFTADDNGVASPSATVSITVTAPNNSSRSDVVALYHLDDNLADATGVNSNLALANNAEFDSSNLGWMTDPSGAALRVFNIYDRASVSLPLSEINRNGQAVRISVGAWIYINSYVGYSVGNCYLLELVDGWNSQFVLNQDMWGTSAQVLAGNQTLTTAAALSSALTTGAWHYVSMALDTNGYTVTVDNNLVTSLASTDLGNWKGTSGYATLQFGDLNGWIDEVSVHSATLAMLTSPPPAPPVLPTVSVVASSPEASDGGTPGAFTFSLSSSATTPITVNYTLGGSAQSGANYVALGSSITIPAGATNATLSVQPINDGVFTGPLTVTLTLATNAAYQVGSSASDTVTIADINRPIISILYGNTGSSSTLSVAPPPAPSTPLQISAVAVPGIAYLVQCSTDLVSWGFIYTNQISTPLAFSDSATTGVTNRFYRVLFVTSLSAPAIASALANGNFSANAVGFVNLTVPPGYSLIANPLDTTNNAIGTLFSSVPLGCEVLEWTGAKYTIDQFSPRINAWSFPNTPLYPGQGAFFFNSASTNLVIPFAGQLFQGALTNSIPAGYSIHSSLVPQNGPVDSLLGFPVADGASIMTWSNGAFVTDTYSATRGTWSATGATGPAIAIGQSFFVNQSYPTNWVRSFSATY